MIVLFQLPGNDRLSSASPFCVKVARALNYKGLRYEVETHTRREARRLTPLRTLPVLSHGGTLIGDSTEILRYLEVRHPEPPLVPESPEAVARGRLFEDWADESLYFYVSYMRWCVDDNYARFKAAFPDTQAFSRSRARQRLKNQGLGKKDEVRVAAELRRHLDDLDTLLDGRDFLVAPHVSCADLAVFAMLDGLCVGITPECERLIKERASLWSWMGRVDEITGVVI